MATTRDHDFSAHAIARAQSDSTRKINLLFSSSSSFYEARLNFLLERARLELTNKLHSSVKANMISNHFCVNKIGKRFIFRLREMEQKLKVQKLLNTCHSGHKNPFIIFVHTGKKISLIRNAEYATNLHEMQDIKNDSERKKSSICIAAREAAVCSRLTCFRAKGMTSAR